jgi:hypothetical protein
MDRLTRAGICPPLTRTLTLHRLDDKHSKMHLRVVVLGLQLADDAQVRLVRAGVDHRARRPVSAVKLPRAESPSAVTIWK